MCVRFAKQIIEYFNMWSSNTKYWDNQSIINKLNEQVAINIKGFKVFYQY